MDQLWNGILDFLSRFVIPDWGSFILSLMPILLAALGVLFVLAMLAVFALAPRFAPTTRGRRRLPSMPPPGVHEGQPSIAPLLVAVGAAILFFGVVFKGPVLAVGIVVLVAALLYWGREAMQDYRRLESHSAAAGVAVEPGLRPLESLAGRTLPRLMAPSEPAAPPPADPHAAHMPVPSFRPILVSIGAAVLFFGLVFGPAILLAGVVMLAIALIGWLIDARREYAAIDAGAGHAAGVARAPRAPVGTLVLFAVVLLVAVAARTGIMPGFGGSGGTAPGASPAASANAGGAAGGAGGQGASATINLAAQNIQFDTKSLEAPANKALTIQFANNDAGVPHNVAIHKDSPTGQEVWHGNVVTGPTKTTYNVPALAAGTYSFVCSVHPNTMFGTLTVR